MSAFTRVYTIPFSHGILFPLPHHFSQRELLKKIGRLVVVQGGMAGSYIEAPWYKDGTYTL